MIVFSKHRKGSGKKFFAEAERTGLEGIMAKRADERRELETFVLGFRD